MRQSTVDEIEKCIDYALRNTGDVKLRNMLDCRETKSWTGRNIGTRLESPIVSRLKALEEYLGIEYKTVDQTLPKYIKKDN